ncbi:MAG TPA: hypothetical protein PK788_02330, partial [Gemmatimonadaceae bacterium]|nr:hypothetical protein [Gemmatimonadaceae bacterium]
MRPFRGSRGSRTSGLSSPTGRDIPPSEARGLGLIQRQQPTRIRSVIVGIPKESSVGERRVALVPESVGRLVKAGVTVRVERGAGTAAGFPDTLYEAAGATLVDAASAFSADLVCKVQKPTAAEIAQLATGAQLISLLAPSTSADAIVALESRGVNAFALELVPRITRAQSMDVLSSQATVAGYKAVLIGASASPKFLPMLTTAAGTIAPSKVCVLGAGVAGLQAIATARRPRRRGQRLR